MNYPGGIRQVAESLLQSRFAVFAGAGLSFGAGIPLANAFQRFVIGRLEFSEAATEEFLRVRLPFEAIFEVLLSVSDWDSLLPVFAGRQPARNHTLLAKLCGSGHLDTIVTTNFDALIEDAFDAEGFPFRLYVSEEALSKIDWDAGINRVIKLHGTVRDPSGLALTIRRVAARHLTASRGKVIREFLSPTRIEPCLVFGYSASDRFDISPAVRNITGPRRPVIYLHHDPTAVTPRRLRLVDTDPDHVFAAGNAEILICRADDLVSALWESAFNGPAPSVEMAADPWTAYVDTWLEDGCRQHGAGFVPYLSGLLQKAANNWYESNRLLECALDKGIRGSSAAGVELAKGNNYRDMGDATQARVALSRALELARSNGQADKEASALNSLGIVAEDEKLHDVAIGYYAEALEIASKTGHRELEGKCHGNIGIALKNKGGDDNLALTVYHHLRALAIARELGDKRSEGRSLGNLGITHSDIGERDIAQLYYEKARAIASELGDRLHVAIWLHNAGEDAIAMDNDRAAGLLRQASAIFRQLGQESYAAESESALARIDTGVVTD